MPTISWDGPFPICLARIKELIGADSRQGFESDLTVVFDGPKGPVPSWLNDAPIKVLFTGQQSGPALARNLAAKEAQGDVLMFVDADVELHHDSLTKVRGSFDADPALDALFGSYDDAPAAPGVVSRFRNLLHHHTHHQHPGPACTFWAGCGAIRRDRFWTLGGFDTSFRHPSIEDVDLGLRLWQRGGQVRLDPTLQGCHHKRWTLASMVKTDICFRAIPWSRLILEQGDHPATLNLSVAGRVSGALALLLPVALGLWAVPNWHAAAAVLTALLLGALVLLNLPFHRLHLQRCGWAEAIAGVGLHGIHLICASGTFAAMVLLHGLQRPLAWPPALLHRPALRRALVTLTLVALALAAILVLAKGLVMGWSNSKDLQERLVEWQLFRDGFFPLWDLYGANPPTGIRSSPYPAWAIPLFGLFFHPGGLPQGILTIQLLSLVALAFLAWEGYSYLRPHGRLASWLGALAPVAISGNANALALGQFSIICVGLIVLEWQQLRGGRPGAAGLSWALAMLKPQIALLQGLPLLWNPANRKGLWTGLLLLGLLSSGALLRTGLTPLTYGKHFLGVLTSVVDDGGWNVTWQLAQLKPTFLIPLGAAFMAALALALRWIRKQRWVSPTLQALAAPERWMIQAGLCSLMGLLAFYHRNSDHIMAAPALLALGDLAWSRRRLGISALAVLFGASLWMPASLVVRLPGLSILQNGIWGLSMLVLAVCCLRPRGQGLELASDEPLASTAGRAG